MNAIWLGMESIGETFEEVDCNDFAKIAVEQILDCCSFDENNKTKLQRF